MEEHTHSAPMASRSNRRRFMGLLAGLGAASHARAAELALAEHQIKAAFLYNFTKFITWPGKRPADDFVIGVLGNDAFADELRPLVRDRTIGGRPVRVKLIGAMAEAWPLEVLFVPAGSEDKIAIQLKQLQRAGVLTVGETADFAALGGVVTFHRQGGKVRFSINRASASEAGLKISPQLLKLAVERGASR